MERNKRGNAPNRGYGTSKGRGGKYQKKDRRKCTGSDSDDCHDGGGKCEDELAAIKVATLVSSVLEQDITQGATESGITTLLEDTSDDVTAQPTLDLKVPPPPPRKHSGPVHKEKCSTCHISNGKYRCPGCHGVSCSLQCVKDHKIQHSCNGEIRIDRKISLQEFTDSDLLGDYRFLEDAKRIADNARRAFADAHERVGKGDIVHQSRDYGLVSDHTNKESQPLSVLRDAARRRGLLCQFLSEGMKKRKCNTSRFEKRTDTIFWHMEFRFLNVKPLISSSGHESYLFTATTHWASERFQLCDILRYLCYGCRSDPTSFIYKPSNNNNTAATIGSLRSFPIKIGFYNDATTWVEGGTTEVTTGKGKRERSESYDTDPRTTASIGSEIPSKGEEGASAEKNTCVNVLLECPESKDCHSSPVCHITRMSRRPPSLSPEEAEAVISLSFPNDEEKHLRHQKGDDSDEQSNMLMKERIERFLGTYDIPRNIHGDTLLLPEALTDEGGECPYGYVLLCEAERTSSGEPSLLPEDCDPSCNPLAAKKPRKKYFLLDPSLPLHDNMRRLFFISEYPVVYVVPLERFLKGMKKGDAVSGAASALYGGGDSEDMEFVLVSTDDRRSIRESFRRGVVSIGSPVSQLTVPQKDDVGSGKPISKYSSNSDGKTSEHVDSDINHSKRSDKRLSGIPCRQFQTEKGCPRGDDKCPYWHCPSHRLPKCHYVVNGKVCKMGDKCSFKH